ncbi:hypothetical protein AVEN_52425-1 [Araneus ventricosus]|uniref:Uncharacterized protein n=1 Tax=Araneus ventricosus TaxID=182803 RepID=A0A4Y2CXX3_ARAVE|nr:hypothetical protein AVEN_52425-1 [Araneus ventricosus]
MYFVQLRIAVIPDLSQAGDSECVPPCQTSPPAENYYFRWIRPSHEGKSLHLNTSGEEGFPDDTRSGLVEKEMHGQKNLNTPKATRGRREKLSLYAENQSSAC